ncbi:MAG TPA: regulatory iron-sulfur-containing complex subunit RicT [Aggregatilineaceae bacterium]|nr:regulatory iron-sulfur-containing complex subunit RicT [Aggregatilineaceae bacterium]
MTIYNEDQAQAVSSTVAGVRFFEVGKLYHFGCGHMPDLQVGDYVVVETTRGRQMGQVMNLFAPESDTTDRDYKPILRRATPTDMMSQKLWKSREVEALINCREKAAELGGYADIKFIAAQYNFEGTLLTYLFSSEEKVNTAKLRTALQRGTKARIELRQVGPRDVAKFIGGMGACGIPRCCSTFLTDFSPISIKMAKAQGISLNPSEITGMCGRLRCCLIYEYEQYVEARKQLPKRNKRVGTPHGEGRVIDIHPLKDAVTVLVEETRYLVQREELIPLDEFEALKNKAEAGCSKHGDGPCECGARQGKAEEAEAVVEEEIEEDIVVEEPPEATLDDEPTEDAKTQRRPRRGRRRRSRGHNPKENNNP